MILIPVWTFFILGAFHSGSLVLPFPEGFFPGLIAFTLLIGSIYIVNQISDRESDLENDKLFFIPKAIISVKTAIAETMLLIIGSFTISLIFLSFRFTLVLILSLLLGLLYSLEPVRLKKRAVLDVLANSLGNGILNTLAGWIAVGGDLNGIVVLIPYPFAVASVHLATTLADIEGDSKNSLNTSGVVMGARRGMLLSLSLMEILQPCSPQSSLFRRLSFRSGQ